MPSSRASSPLSSATPSPEPGTVGLPDEEIEAGPSGSKRDSDGSLTSETEPLTDDSESELTADPSEVEIIDEEDEDLDDIDQVEGDEEDGEGEDEEEQEEVEARRDKGDEGENDADGEDGEDERNVHPLNNLKKRLNGVDTASDSSLLSPTPSLTPEPEPGKVKTERLAEDAALDTDAVPNGSNSLTLGEEDDLEVLTPAEVREEEDQNGSMAVSPDKLGKALEEVKAADDERPDETAEADEDEDEENQGDVTLRPPKVEDAETSADESRQVSVNGDEEMDVDGEIGAVNERVDAALVDGDEEMADDGQGEGEGEGEGEVDGEGEGEVDGEGDGEEGEGEDTEQEVVPDAMASSIPAPLRPHSSHAPPPPPAAMRELLMLELKFAAVRDKLYLERMEEAAAEEEMVLKGEHPALTYMYQILAERREKLHEVASRRHQAVLEELVRAREADKSHVWTWWTEERDGLHWSEFAETWSKRRRLAREKTELETIRLPKYVPQAGSSKLSKPFDWSGGATPSRLGPDEAASDLAIMENRRPMVVVPPVQASMYNPPTVSVPAYNINPSQPIPPPVATTSSTYPIAPLRASTSMNAVVDRAGANANGLNQRREGRTVFNTADVFDGPPRKVDKVPPSDVPMRDWAKAQEPLRPLTNGHNPTAHDKAEAITQGIGSAGASGMGARTEDRVSRFPNLTDYLSGSRPSITSPTQRTTMPSYSNLFGGPPKLGNILSPPKTGAGITGRTLFGAQPTQNTSSVGGSQSRT